ncbi:MAG TPA: dCTP deaminase [bacterium]|nr:dCTP deaminase [bacterium]HPN42499.1 dCTP deaminase [bacterium]
MILNDKQIYEAVQNNDIIIKPFDEKQIQGATYDFRVGEQGATTTTKKLVNIKENGYIIISPGDFGVITVLEEIKLSLQFCGRFGLRSKYARKGLLATTGPQIDPGYHGRLIIGVTNLTPKPITLSYKDDFVTLEFHRLEQPSSKPYIGPFQNKLELGAEEIEFITESNGMALSEVLTTLRSLSENVGALSKDVKNLKWILPLIVGFGITIIAILVAIK